MRRLDIIWRLHTTTVGCRSHNFAVFVAAEWMWSDSAMCRRFLRSDKDLAIFERFIISNIKRLHWIQCPSFEKQIIRFSLLPLEWQSVCHAADSTLVGVLVLRIIMNWIWIVEKLFFHRLTLTIMKLWVFRDLSKSNKMKEIFILFLTTIVCHPFHSLRP